MAQLINIPGLQGPIGVDVGVLHTGSGKNRFEDFPDDADPYDANAPLRMPEGDQRAEIKVEAMLHFPPQDGEGNHKPDNAYSRHVYATLPFIIQGDSVQFLATEKVLAGEAFDPRAESRSPFRLIEGKVYLSATQSPRHYLVRIWMLLGSPDGVTNTWETAEEEATWTVTFDNKDANKAGVIDKFGRIFDKVRKMIPSVSAERNEAKVTQTKGGSRTIGQMAVPREWTLQLEMPEPRKPPKPPKPMVFREGQLLPVYFDTNKAEIGHYLEPRYKTDQIKGLIRFVDEAIAKYGIENINSIEVVGHASRLGDTMANITLSSARAKFVADFLKDYFRKLKTKIPDDNINHRGEPVDEGNDKQNPWQDRVVWVTINAVRVVQP